MAKKTATKKAPAKRPPRKPAEPASTPGEADLSHIAEGLRYLAKPIEQLVLDPHNAREHGEKNTDATRASLAAFGQRKTLTVRPVRDTDDLPDPSPRATPVGSSERFLVLKGNGTLLSAQQLGWTHLACATVDDDDATGMAYALADNRTGELAEWDTDNLQRLIGSVGPDSGIDDLLADLDADCQRLIDESPPAVDSPAVDSDDDPAPAPPTTTKRTRANSRKKASDDAAPAADASVELWIHVECRDETEQIELLDEFTMRGHECRRVDGSPAAA